MQKLKMLKKTKISICCGIAGIVIIAISLAIYQLLQVYNSQVPELQLVTVVFRHGDRTPHTDTGEAYANNPNADNNYFPVGQGALTNEGKLRVYNLGKFLRERYNNFLGSTYLPEAVEARSTNYDRTKASLLLVLAGLYPPNNYQMWNSSINWQPIPTYYEPETEDILLSTHLCSRFEEEKEKIMQLPEFQERLNMFKTLMETLTISSGRDIKNYYDICKVYYAILLEHQLNLTIPNWAYDYINDPRMNDTVMLNYEIKTYNSLIKKLSAGPLIRKMSEDMISIRNGSFTKGRKIYLYSGHEINVAVLLAALGVYKLHLPQFSCAVMVELYRLKDEFYIQVVHHLGIPPEIHIYEIPGCSKLCPLDKFLELMKSVTPEKDEIICDKLL